MGELLRLRAEAARSVGRVVEAPVRQPVRPIRTGSLVTDRLLVTNNHVCETREDAEQMAVQFGYEYAEDGSERPHDQWRFAPGDFSSPIPTSTTRWSPWPSARAPRRDRGTDTPAVREDRRGGSARCSTSSATRRVTQRVSIRSHRMVTEDDLWVRYESDTREGSSGHLSSTTSRSWAR
ncbi:hypothetical protein [Geodermatophilus sp. CPCC 205506]|uniref:hypothetical protein n=1 Tax=Geodermatophilus sp. CPCC 205506 TaxID=2936596 RepID=UPI003EE91075